MTTQPPSISGAPHAAADTGAALETATGLALRIGTLTQQQSDIKASLTDYANRKMGWNPIEWVKRGWERTVTVPSLNRRLGKLVDEQEDTARALLSTGELHLSGTFNVAADTQDTAYLDALRRRSSAAAGLETDATFLARTDTMLKTLKSTRDECEGARTMEHFDMFSNNSGISLLSYLETSSAADALRDVKGQMETYRNHVEKYRESRVTLNISDHRIDDLTASNNFDLVIDLISEFAGIFSSMRNAEKLGQAVDKLDQSLEQIGQIRTKVHDTMSRTALEFINADREVTELRRDMAERAENEAVRDLLEHRADALAFLKGQMLASTDSPLDILGGDAIKSAHAWRKNGPA